MLDPSNEQPSRRVDVTLGVQQQGVLLPQLSQFVCAQLGISEMEAGIIAVEALARLTNDMTLSEITVRRTILDEVEAFRADPGGYEARCSATTYIVHGLTTESPEDLGSFSPDLLQLYAPTVVPKKADQVKDWWDFAHDVAGYEIAQRLGWELSELATAVLAYHQSTGRWPGSLLDLRLTLFYQARAFRHWGVSIEEAGEDFRCELKSLLAAIGAAQGTDTPD